MSRGAKRHREIALVRSPRAGRRIRLLAVSQESARAPWAVAIRPRTGRGPNDARDFFLSNAKHEFELTVSSIHSMTARRKIVIRPSVKATCDFAPSGGRKAARARPSHRACAIAPRRSVHRSNSGRRPTSRSRDPECERAPEHEVFLTVMYRCTAEPSVHVYLPCSGYPPEHGHAIFHVQVIHLNIHLRTFNVQQCCCTWIIKKTSAPRGARLRVLTSPPHIPTPLQKCVFEALVATWAPGHLARLQRDTQEAC